MKTRRSGGYTLLEIMIVVAIIGVLALITYPGFARARRAAQLTSCQDRLRQIDAAVDQFALENKKILGDPVTVGDISPYLKRVDMVLTEPTGGDYTIEFVGEDPSCSNFDSALHPATI